MEAWERRAMVAVEEGRDDLAKLALEKCQRHLDVAQQRDADVAFQAAALDEYRLVVRDLQERLAREP